MNHKSILKTALLTASLLLSLSLGAKVRKTVYIIIDGVPADVKESLTLPAIEEIESKGAYGRSYVGGTVGRYDETPTISAVGYTDILTATWVNKHNVPGNSNLKPNYNYWTIFRIAKEQKREVKTGLFSSWIDNRTVLIGEGKPETNNLKIDDDAGHIFGNGAALDESVRLADRQIQRIWDAVKYREKNFDEEWMVIVTTDHGRGYDGYNHGGQSERERVTWVATNKKVNQRMKSGLSAAVDIAPSICKFMGFEVPRDVRWEQDGTSFYGQSDIMEMDIQPYDNTVNISWMCLNKKAEVTVYATPTNNYKEGGKDEWIKVGTVPASAEKYTVNLENLPASKFYKFVLDTPNGSLNRWYNGVPEKYTTFKFPKSYYTE